MKAAITGIGMVRPSRPQSLSGMRLAGLATRDAIADAGLEPGQIDGIVVQHGSPVGPDYDTFCQYMGLRVDMATQTWPHGRYTGLALQMAAMMVEQGLATHVACVNGYQRSSGTIGGMAWQNWDEENRPGGGPHGEEPAVGLTAPMSQAAMALRAYVETYRVDRERLYDVAAAQRRSAGRNPVALYRDEITPEDYRDSRHIIEPLRKLDCAPVTEGGSCVIVSRLAAARGLPNNPVRILGIQGLPSGRAEFIWSRPGLGLAMQDFDPNLEVVNPVYERAGVTQDDVDVFACYDSFAPLVWFGLERFGFCEPGQAPDFIRSRGIDHTGTFPVNTGGGMLSEGSKAGWGHILELVRQLRGTAGDRQVPGAEIAQWGPCFGDSVVFAAA
jgi:acetyl-CoA acetyltransferase